MRRFWYVGVALLTLSFICGAALSPSRAEADHLSGDYVEARTASVFAGACHYNGELTTTGRDAVMAWNITTGSWDGVRLAGVRALAVVGVRRAPVVFRHDGSAYSVGTSDAALNVEAMPDNLCCRMPQLVWYAPLVPVEGRKVGYTRKATYAGGAAGDSWERAGENGAFYGSFSL